MILWGLSSKESPCNVGDEGLIPGLGRSPGGGNGNPLQYSCLRNPMDRGAPRVTVRGIAKSQTQRLNNNKNKTSREKSIKQNYKTFRNTLVILEEKFQNKGLGKEFIDSTLKACSVKRKLGTSLMLQ